MSRSEGHDRAVSGHTIAGMVRATPCGYETASPATGLDRHPRQHGDIISRTQQTRGAAAFYASPRCVLYKCETFHEMTF